MFRKDLQVNIATNGGVRDKKFWTELGLLTQLHREQKEVMLHRVVWGIDGLEDTKSYLYRRNVKWDKLQDNFRAYISIRVTLIGSFIF